jgi:hypothetical protein
MPTLGRIMLTAKPKIIVGTHVAKIIRACFLSFLIFVLIPQCAKRTGPISITLDIMDKRRKIMFAAHAFWHPS